MTWFRTKPLPWSAWLTHDTLFLNQETHCERRTRKIGYSPLAGNRPSSIYELEERRETVHRLEEPQIRESVRSSVFYQEGTLFEQSTSYYELCTNCLTLRHHSFDDEHVPCQDCRSITFTRVERFGVSDGNPYYKDAFLTRTKPFPPALKEELLAVAWHPDRPHVFEFTLPYEELQALQQSGIMRPSSDGAGGP